MSAHAKVLTGLLKLIVAVYIVYENFPAEKTRHLNVSKAAKSLVRCLKYIQYTD